MADLRQQLERLSEGFHLEPNAIERMFVRAERVQRRRRLSAAVVAIVIGVLGITAGIRAFPNGTVPVDTSPSPSPAAAPTIPEGVYWTRPLKRPEVMDVLTRAGFTRAEAVEFFFSRALAFGPTLAEGLIVQDGFWVQTAKNASGRQEAGWSGSFEVVNDHRIRATGYGCAITYRYGLQGDTLTLNVLRETGSSPECGHGDLVAQTAIFDVAPFVLEPDAPPPSA
jgi:hypothetical protein